MEREKKTYLVIINSYALYDEDREVDRIEVNIAEEDFDKEETINMIKEKYRPKKFPPGTNWFIKIMIYLGEAQAPVIERFYLESYIDGLLSKTGGMYNF